MASPSSPPVVVVGAGLAGLSAAVRVAQAGLPVLVLDASQVGFAASIRNQGWLYSGAFFAPDCADLASRCYESLRQTVEYCPECLEPRHEGMAFLVSDPETEVGRWIAAWDRAHLPWSEPEPARLFAQLPGLDHARVARAFLLPDRSIRTEVLLARLADQARQAGAEIRTHEHVVRLEVRGSRIEKVVTGEGDEIATRLVVLAGGVRGLQLLSDLTEELTEDEAGRQADYTLVTLKTHLASVSPEMGHLPFCVVDAEGFNHLPHESKSIFGTQRWLPVATTTATRAVPEELERLWGLVGRFFPQFERQGYETAEWAGLTVQAMSAEQIEPGQTPLPTVIDHRDERPGVENLVSLFPGRASLWPHLAEEACRRVLDNLGRDAASVPLAPWAGRK